MPTVVAALIALIGALIQTRRHETATRPIFTWWWTVAVVGVASLFGAA